MKIDIKATNLDLTPAIREYIEIKIGSLNSFLRIFEAPKESPEGEPRRRTSSLRGRQVPYGAGKFPTGRAESEIEVFVEIARTTKHHHKGDVFYAEATFSIGKKILRAEHSDWDIRVAIDKVKDKLQQEIKKYRDIKIEKYRKKR